VRLEGLGQLKNPVTSWRFEPAIFRHVVQCLNQLRYRMPHLSFSPCFHLNSIICFGQIGSSSGMYDDDDDDDDDYDDDVHTYTPGHENTRNQDTIHNIHIAERNGTQERI
jgi:hypothetical protein